MNPTSNLSEADQQPIGYDRGRLVPDHSIRLPLDDAGLRQGILVSDLLRTYNGKTRFLEQHLKRLGAGLQTVSIRVPEAEIRQAIADVARHNTEREPAGSDLQVSVLVTPGSPGDDGQYPQPTLVVTGRRLPFSTIDRGYREGIGMASVETREIPGACIPRHLKHRNRIHYWIAEQEARRVDPSARAILRDTAGLVCEGTISGIAIVTPDGQLVAPPADQTLGSVSLEFAGQLLAARGKTLQYRPLSLNDLGGCREMLSLSSSMGVYPVTRFNGEPVGHGHPGEVFQQLLADWSRETGVDLAAQAARFATRAEAGPI